MLRQVDLRAGVAHAAEQWHDRRTEMNGQLARLVEAAAVFAQPMQRHRHDRVGTAQHVGAAGAHQRAKPRRNRSPAIVFERVHDLAHAAFVVVDGGGPNDRMPIGEPFVQPRRQAQGSPARLAHGAGQRRCEGLPARRTGRLEQRCNQQVGPGPESRGPGRATPRREIRCAWRCPRGDRGRKNRARAARRCGRRSRSSRGGSTRRGRSPPPATAAASRL